MKQTALIFNTVIIFYFIFWVQALNLEPFVFCKSKPGIDTKKPLPPIADVFSVTLELNQYLDYPEARTPTTYIDLSYDKTANKLALKALVEGNTGEALVDFSSSQIFTFTYPEEPTSECGSECCCRQQCSTAEQCKSVLTAILPQLTSFNFSVDKTFPGLEIFGVMPDYQTKSTYIGNDTWSDLSVDRWDFCSQSGSDDTVWTNMSIFWTVDGWTTPLKDQKIPALMRMKFNVGGNTTSEVIQIKPVDYRPHETTPTETFQPPNKCFCPTWPGNRDFPSQMKSDVFHFHTEAIVAGTNVVGWTEEWFDLDTGYIRLDHKTPEADSLTTDIIDYNLKLVYMITGRYRDGCYIRSLSDVDLSIMETATTASLMHFRMKTPSNFFGSDNTTFINIGERKVRGMDSYVWQGVRSDQLGGSNVTALWEWYMKKPSTPTDDLNIPLKRSYTLLSEEDNSDITATHVEFKVNDQIIQHISGFEYLTEDIDVSVFDVMPCYSQEDYLQLKFQTDISITEDIYTSGDIFGPSYLYKWRNALADLGKVSHLRIAKVGTEIFKDQVYLKFNLLNVHSVAPVEAHKNDPVTMEKAEENIVKAIGSGQMRIKWDKHKRTNIMAKVNTLQTTIFSEPTCPPPTPPDGITDNPQTVQPPSETTTHASAYTQTPPDGITDNRQVGSVSKTTTHASGSAVAVGVCCLLVGMGSGFGTTYLTRNYFAKFFLPTAV